MSELHIVHQKLLELNTLLPYFGPRISASVISFIRYEQDKSFLIILRVFMTQGLNTLSKGEGVPLVFQHGLTASVKQTESLLDGIKDLHILAIDCPGHGLSRLPADYEPTFNQYADEVLGFLNERGIHQAVFGGISMGSGIAVNIALRHPERVKALILVRPAWLDYKDPENLRILLPAAKLLTEINGRKRFESLPEFKKLEPLAAAQSVLGVFAPEQQPELVTVIECMVNDRPFESMNELKNILVPTMVVGNDDDPLHPLWMSKKVQENIDNSVLKEVTSRYIDNDLHRDQVRQHIKDFIKENNLH